MTTWEGVQETESHVDITNHTIWGILRNLTGGFIDITQAHTLLAQMLRDAEEDAYNAGVEAVALGDSNEYIAEEDD